MTEEIQVFDAHRHHEILHLWRTVNGTLSQGLVEIRADFRNSSRKAFSNFFMSSRSLDGPN